METKLKYAQRLVILGAKSSSPSGCFFSFSDVNVTENFEPTDQLNYVEEILHQTYRQTYQEDQIPDAIPQHYGREIGLIFMKMSHLNHSENVKIPKWNYKGEIVFRTIVVEIISKL